MTEEQRAEKLIAELDDGIAQAIKRGRRNYSAAYLLSFVGVIGSILAGVFAVLPAPDKWQVGLAGLIPGAATLLSIQFKLQPRANFFYRLAEAMRSLRSELAFSDPATRDVAAVAKSLCTLRERMTGEWEGALGAEAQVARLPSVESPR